MEVAMSGEPDYTRRWLINASGAAILSNAFGTAQAQEAAPAAAAGRARRDVSADPTVRRPPTSADATAIANYVPTALARNLPAELVAATKLHILDTIAAITSGSRLKA